MYINVEILPKPSANKFCKILELNDSRFGLVSIPRVERLFWIILKTFIFDSFDCWLSSSDFSIASSIFSRYSNRQWLVAIACHYKLTRYSTFIIKIENWSNLLFYRSLLFFRKCGNGVATNINITKRYCQGAIHSNVVLFSFKRADIVNGNLLILVKSQDFFFQNSNYNVQYI